MIQLRHCFSISFRFASLILLASCALCSCGAKSSIQSLGIVDATGELPAAKRLYNARFLESQKNYEATKSIPIGELGALQYTFPNEAFAPSLVLESNSTKKKSIAFDFTEPFRELQASALGKIRFCHDMKSAAALLYTPVGPALIVIELFTDHWEALDLTSPHDLSFLDCKSLLLVQREQSGLFLEERTISEGSDETLFMPLPKECLQVTLSPLPLVDGSAVRCNTGKNLEWFLYRKGTEQPLPISPKNKLEVIALTASKGALFAVTESLSGESVTLWKSPIQEESGGAKKWIQLSNFKSSDQIGGIVAFPQGLFIKQAEGSHSSYLFYPEFHPEAAVPLTVPECALSLTQPIGATDTAQFDCETQTSYSTTVRFDLKNLHFSRPKNDVPGAVFLTAVSRDGTLVPYSIYPPKDGTQNPARAILTSYGAYGVESSVTFNRMWSILSEEGFHLVVAHPRGGGYYGRPWREGGRAGNKLNTVSDLIAVAKAIRKHLDPIQLIGHGKSAGAWPFVASLTESSTLFDALLLEMPVLDPLGQLDPADPFLVQEVYEWGEPKNPHIRNMYQKYSPCTGEDHSAIPPMYIRVGSDDERVPPEGVIRWIKSFTKCHKNASIFLEQSDKTGHLGSYNLYDEIASESLRTHFLTHIAETR